MAKQGATTELSFSGSGSLIKHHNLADLNTSFASVIPRYSTINSLNLYILVRETSNKVGNADFYVFFGNDSNSSIHQLYYGNGKIPKNNKSDLEVSLDLTQWTASNTENAHRITYSGATRMCYRCQSSLLSRNYKLKVGYTFDFTYPTYTIKTTAGTGGKVTETATYDVTVADQTKTITATPNAGYNFVKWVDSNGKTYTDKNVSVTISHKSISAHSTTVTYTAYFEPIPPPKFTSAEMKYLDKQISSSNRVICNEGFIVSVAVT